MQAGSSLARCRRHRPFGLNNWHSTLVVVLVAVALVLLSGCTTETSQSSAQKDQIPGDGLVLYDLAHSLPVAIKTREIKDHRLGSAEARPFLGQGWSWNERNETGPFAWSQGEESTVDFYLLEARPLDLIARGLTLPDLLEQSPEGPVRVTVSNSFGLLGVFEFSTPTTDQATLRIPAAALTTGFNTLSLTYSKTFPTSDRRLAVAWSRLALVSPTVSPSPASGNPSSGPTASGLASALTRVDGLTLQIPSESEVQFSVDLVPGTALHWDELRFAGLANRLRLELFVGQGPDRRKVQEVWFPKDHSTSRTPGQADSSYAQTALHIEEATTAVVVLATLPDRAAIGAFSGADLNSEISNSEISNSEIHNSEIHGSARLLNPQLVVTRPSATRH